MELKQIYKRIKDSRETNDYQILKIDGMDFKEILVERISDKLEIWPVYTEMNDTNKKPYLLKVKLKNNQFYIQQVKETKIDDLIKELS